MKRRKNINADFYVPLLHCLQVVNKRKVVYHAFQMRHNATSVDNEFIE